MRKAKVTIMLMAMLVGDMPAFALKATDSMKGWGAASEQDHSKLLSELLGKRSPNAAALGRILKCMNETSEMPAHSDLAIREVVKACAEMGSTQQPV